MLQIGGGAQLIVGNQLATLNGLQERVMQVARDSGAFGQAFIETSLHGSSNPAHPQAINRPEQQHADNGTQRAKPDCLIPRRSNLEVQRRSGFIPYSVVIRCDHSKAITSRSKIAVERLAAQSRILPAHVTALEQVAKGHPLRQDEAERGVIDLNVSREWRKRDGGSR